MKLFIAMVSVGALLGTMPVMAAEQPELPTKVQDIANGSDELYGEGVPIEHGTNPDERFSSGGVDHTHQYIVANALKILSNDKGNSAFNGELNSSILMEATDWPDKLGNETDAGTFAGHFYDPDTGKNWLGQKSPTARTRAESYFQAAVNAYRAGDVQLAMSNLGKGTHYVSDLNEPHHASNLTAVNSNHSAFEKYVDKNRKSYTIAGNSFGSSVYTTALNTSTGDLMYSAAKHAKGLAADAQKESSYDSAGRQSVQHAIEKVFGLYKAHIQKNQEVIFWNLWEQYLKSFLIPCPFYACKAGLTTCYVTTDGGIYTCAELPEFKIGSVEAGLDVPRIREIIYLEDQEDTMCKKCQYIRHCKTRGCQVANYEIHQNVYQPIKVNCEVTKWMYHLIQTNLTEKQLEKLKQEYERRYLRHGK
ncbi:SPASM domain-containing protein [Blautia massiliensis]|nr:SPASM domain-containing protein [Blautia massiliensis (ex Durand et al. 2017)]NSK93748.1 SPASM domain-containing protein [Blautia massiliensis (ex Durand et al. 2017)]